MCSEAVNHENRKKKQESVSDKSDSVYAGSWRMVWESCWMVRESEACRATTPSVDSQGFFLFAPRMICSFS